MDDQVKLFNLLQHYCWEDVQQYFNPIVLCLILLIFTFVVFNARRGPKLNLPPSPTRLPIIGNLHQLGALLHRSLHALSEKYGPLILVHIFNVPTLVASSEEMSREILNNPAFQNRPQTKVTKVLFHGCDIVFSEYGDYWREAKKLCVVELLSSKRVQGFHYVTEEEAAKMIEYIRSSCSRLEAASVDLSEMFLAIASDIVSRCALGAKYERDDGSESFGVMAKRAVELIGAFNFEDLVPSLRWIDTLTGFNARLRKTAKELHGLVDRVIEEHKQRSGNQSDNKKDLVDILLHLQNDGRLQDYLTEESIKAILLDMFIGGTDNNASVMEWAMAELVKNPNLMCKAQEEVRRVVGNKSKIDEMDMDQMDFLKCIIKETLRIYPPVMIPRESSVPTKLQGYDIPARARILINPWSIQRDPKIWERPEEFIPERFLNNPIDFKGSHGQYIPFGSGRRVCPGIIFTITQVEYVLANLLYWFDWKLPCGQNVHNFDMSETSLFGLAIRKKVPLRLVPIMFSSSS